MDTPLTLQAARAKQNELVEELHRLQRMLAVAPDGGRDDLSRTIERLKGDITEIDHIISEFLNKRSAARAR